MEATPFKAEPDDGREHEEAESHVQGRVVGRLNAEEDDEYRDERHEQGQRSENASHVPRPHPGPAAPVGQAPGHGRHAVGDEDEDDRHRDDGGINGSVERKQH